MLVLCLNTYRMASKKKYKSRQWGSKIKVVNATERSRWISVSYTHIYKIYSKKCQLMSLWRVSFPVHLITVVLWVKFPFAVVLMESVSSLVSLTRSEGQIDSVFGVKFSEY